MPDGDYNSVHAKRFALSLDALTPFMAKRCVALECGGMSAFTPMMASRFPDATIVCTFGDLREDAFTLLDAGAVDVVVAMEVLEHIHDRDTELPTEWRGTGTARMLGECRRVLRPGGVLFLTTPNAASTNVLHKILHHQPPMIYRPHVREYTTGEVRDMLKGAGFGAVKIATHDCWGTSMLASERQRLELLYGAYGKEDRGEDIFAVAVA
jgi:SAM-dependent methyltransferase